MKTLSTAVKAFKAIDPIAASAVQTSAAIDTLGFTTGMVIVNNGAATGTPDSYTVNAKVQHCDTSGGSYSDVSGASITALTADSKVSAIPLSSFGKNLKRYIKVLVTPAMTGGSTPKALIGATVVLGNAYSEPVTNTQ